MTQQRMPEDDHSNIYYWDKLWPDLVFQKTHEPLRFNSMVPAASRISRAVHVSPARPMENVHEGRSFLDDAPEGSSIVSPGKTVSDSKAGLPGEAVHVMYIYEIKIMRCLV